MPPNRRSRRDCGSSGSAWDERSSRRARRLRCRTTDRAPFIDGESERHESRRHCAERQRSKAPVAGTGGSPLAHTAHRPRDSMPGHSPLDATEHGELASIYTPRRRLGTGPAFPGIYTATDPWLQTTTAKLSRIRDPDIPLPRDWLIAKVLWMMQRGYNAPLIVRGHQVDGRGEMRFYQPVRASSRSGNEVRLIGNRQGPSNFAVPGPGCYAWQLDGKGVSKVLVFRVVEARR